MDSDRFDALSRTLGKPESRRGALATLAALAGLGALFPHDLDAKKKKKKKKKKKTCKTTNQNCTSGADCCNGLICAVGSFQEECESVDGDVCCLTPGKSCSHTCDCCGSGAICGDDNKCCIVHLAECAEDGDCCEDEFCVDEAGGGGKSCRTNNFGSPCEVDNDCIGGLFCIDTGGPLGVSCGCQTSRNPCDADGDDDDDCCPGTVCGANDFCCVPTGGTCQFADECCTGNCGCVNNTCVTTC